MCKTLQTYEWCEFLIIFCAAVTVTTFLIFGFLTYLGLLDRLNYYGFELSNVWKKSTFKSGKTVWLRSDFCRIWKKCRIPARAGAKIRYSPSVCMSVCVQFLQLFTTWRTSLKPRATTWLWCVCHMETRHRRCRFVKRTILSRIKWAIM